MEILEQRLALSTFTWTGNGDGQSWNNPSNWEHRVPLAPYEATGVPTPGSNVIFPAIAGQYASTARTINLNFNGPSFPVSSLTIANSYTFTGNAIAVQGLLATTNSYAIALGATTATFLNSGLSLAPGATINTDSGSTLQISNAGNTTGLALSLASGVAKAGAGTLVIDTPNINVPTGVNFTPIPFYVTGGTVTLGASMSLRGVNLQLASYTTLTIADGVAASLGAVSGSGLLNLAGTTTAGDQTALTVAVARATTDTFGGTVGGIGQFIAGGQGTLSTGAIRLGPTSTITVKGGTLDVDGAIAAGSLLVDDSASFGGLGSWLFSGPVVFQAGSTFDLTLDGTVAGLQYTQLADSSTTSGINLGYASLAASIDYQYQAGDQYQVISSPVVTGVFGNVVSGNVVLNGTVPFQVASGTTAVRLTALQSITTTALSSSGGPTYPGQPVTFTATVNTRTSPVTSGSVSFMQGSTVLASVPLNGAGVAVLTTTVLPTGTSTITAFFTGSGGNLASSSKPVFQTVIPFTTAVAIASAANPVFWGQPLTLTAFVTAGGAPVSAGTVTFVRAGTRLGTVALGTSGAASVTVTTLPPGKVRIQAIYNGAPGYLSAVSPVFTQTIAPAPTTTSLSIISQTVAGGRTRLILTATVRAVGASATGTVVFRSNGRSIGRARIKNGTAVLVLSRNLGRSHSFIAAYQGSAKFRGSSSTPTTLLA